MKTLHRIFFADVLYWTALPILKWKGINPRSARVTRRSLNWNLDLSESIELSIFFTGTFEPDVSKSYARILRPGDKVIDIGANSGVHTLRFAELVGPTGSVIAFEATKYALNKLKNNLNLNPHLLLRVKVEHSFLTTEINPEKPLSVSSSFRLASFSENEKRNEKDYGFSKSTAGAMAISLDRYCELNGLEKIDLIKIDVDGNEPEAISGSLRAIRLYQPFLLAEIAPGHFIDQPERFHAWLNSILALNYRLYDLNHRALHMTSDSLWKQTKVGSYSNIWLVPMSREAEFERRAMR